MFYDFEHILRSQFMLSVSSFDQLFNYYWAKF